MISDALKKKPAGTQWIEQHLGRQRDRWSMFQAETLYQDMTRVLMQALTWNIVYPFYSTCDAPAAEVFLFQIITIAVSCISIICDAFPIHRWQNCKYVFKDTLSIVQQVVISKDFQVVGRRWKSLLKRSTSAACSLWSSCKFLDVITTDGGITCDLFVLWAYLYF